MRDFSPGGDQKEDPGSGFSGERYDDISAAGDKKCDQEDKDECWCLDVANLKRLQYLIGHSDISVTMNDYKTPGLEDVAEETGRIQKLENARKEQEKLICKKEEVISGRTTSGGEKPVGAIPTGLFARGFLLWYPINRYMRWNYWLKDCENNEYEVVR